MEPRPEPLTDPAFARLPDPKAESCYAAIFSSRRNAADEAAYERTAERMMDLAREQPGYLGVESARGADGFGITVSYWRDEASILAWKRHVDHAFAREQGRTRWYEHYELRVAKLERAYGKR